MNTPNNVTTGLYCEIDRFRCLKCGHDDYRHRYRCQRHLIGDAYCREAIPMITPDRNVFCGDCAEDTRLKEIIGSDDLDISDQGRMSPELLAIQYVPASSNMTQGGTAETQPASANTSQAPHPADPNMSSGGCNEPRSIPLSPLNPQFSAHVPPVQDDAIAPLASQNPPSAPPSSWNSNITRAPPLASEPTPPQTPTAEPTPPPTATATSPSTLAAQPAAQPAAQSAARPAARPAVQPAVQPAAEESAELAPIPAIRHIGIWERLRRWCCGSSSEESAA
ncbi:uncharacterized protein EAF01_004104 [Botrytis porri]|uniref:uncharacterized protein n=1 Tax=Botrytis porri TaxID=87229 RepID=UPI0019028A41|nr:uncharacterized protein EAF01_004104 [Botrytis porri]KAF7908349.1 hypothetical protein EAF01_004104 [Botrytis porri]